MPEKNRKRKKEKKKTRIRKGALLLLLAICALGTVVVVVLLATGVLQTGKKSLGVSLLKEAKEKEKNYYTLPEPENVLIDESTGVQYVNNMVLVSATANAKYADIELLAKA